MGKSVLGTGLVSFSPYAFRFIWWIHCWCGQIQLKSQSYMENPYLWLVHTHSGRGIYYVSLLVISTIHSGPRYCPATSHFSPRIWGRWYFVVVSTATQGRASRSSLFYTSAGRYCSEHVVISVGHRLRSTFSDLYAWNQGRSNNQAPWLSRQSMHNGAIKVYAMQISIC